MTTSAGITGIGVAGIGLWGPGLEGWAASRPVLAGDAPYEERQSPAPPPAILGAAERRRAGPVVRLALAVAQEAAAASGVPPADLRAVFASGNGDGVIVGSILGALAAIPEGAAGEAARIVSPTQFHNSVHNAAAGYWSIATGGRSAASSLGFHDDTLAAGLLTALATVATEDAPVLLCAYDHPLPPPLDRVRHTVAPFGVAFVLTPGARPRLDLRYVPQAAVVPETPRDPALAPLAAGNAIARALPLLETLARGAAGTHRLPYLDGHLVLETAP